METRVSFERIYTVNKVANSVRKYASSTSIILGNYRNKLTRPLAHYLYTKGSGAFGIYAEEMTAVYEKFSLQVSQHLLESTLDKIITATEKQIHERESPAVQDKRDSLAQSISNPSIMQSIYQGASSVGYVVADSLLQGAKQKLKNQFFREIGQRFFVPMLWQCHEPVTKQLILQIINAGANSIAATLFINFIAATVDTNDENYQNASFYYQTITNFLFLAKMGSLAFQAGSAGVAIAKAHRCYAQIVSLNNNSESLRDLLAKGAIEENDIVMKDKLAATFLKIPQLFEENEANKISTSIVYFYRWVQNSHGLSDEYIQAELLKLQKYLADNLGNVIANTLKNKVGLDVNSELLSSILLTTPNLIAAVPEASNRISGHAKNAYAYMQHGYSYVGSIFKRTHSRPVEEQSRQEVSATIASQN